MTSHRIPLDGVPRAEWLALRLPNINASEVPIVLGEAHYGSAAELYAEKKGLRPPREDTRAMRRGRWGEAAVFEAIAEERPEWDVRRAKVYVVDETARTGCTPDGFAFRPDRPGIGIIQAKVVAAGIFRDRWLEDGGDIEAGEATPPVPFVLQTITEMMLNESEWGCLAVIINGEFDWWLRIFDIERDAVVEHLIRERVQDFFDRFLDPGIMPAFEPQRDARLIRQLYPKDTGEIIDLSTDNRACAVLEELTEVAAGRKRLEGREAELKTELQGKLGDASYAKVGEQWLSWRLTNFKAYTVAADSRRVFRVHKSEPKGLK